MVTPPRWLERALALGGPTAIAALGLPLAAGVAALRGLGLGAADVAGVWAVRAWSAALALVLVVALLRAVLARSAAAGLVALGLLLLVAQGWWGALRSYRAYLELGEGEPVLGWTGVEEGRPPPEPPELLFQDPPERAGGAFHLRGSGRDLYAPLGRAAELAGDVRVTITRWEAAPSVSVLKQDGVVDQVLAKLHPGPRPPEYVQLSVLPHRFYLSAAASSPPASGAAPGAPPSVAERMLLRIQRGKLTILKREVGKGERVPFDGRTFRYADGATWIRLDVERRVGWGLAWTGAALLAAAGALVLVRRRA